MFKIILSLLLLLLLFVNNYYNLVRYLSININPSLNTLYNTLPRVDKNKKVIISFTTLPSRIENSKYMISSILSQSKKVDEIRLYIPLKTTKNQKYKIPKWMIKLQKILPEFKIKRCEKDFGPATKIIPALLDEKDNDTYIIYLDDDMIYHSETIETLISYSNTHPKYAICNSEIEVQSKKIVKVLAGFAGVIVHPSFFNFEKLLNIENYPREVFFNDDVFLTGILAENKIKRIATGKQRSIPHLYEFLFGYLLHINPVSLSSTFNKSGNATKKAISYFKF